MEDKPKHVVDGLDTLEAIFAISDLHHVCFQAMAHLEQAVQEHTDTKEKNP